MRLKKGVLILFMLLILVSSVSASWWSDLFGGAVYSDNLVVHLDFDKNIYDQSSHSNDGNRHGDAFVSPVGAKSGNSINFDGVRDNVEIYYDDSLDVSKTNSFTMSVWIYSNEYGSDANSIAGQWDSGEKRVWRVFVDKDTNKLVVSLSSDGKDRPLFYGDTALEEGKWQHVTVSFDNGQLKMYLDGVLDGVHTWDKSLFRGSKRTICIGMVNDLKEDSCRRVFQGFIGKMDEFRLYDGALQDSEVRDLYELRSDPIVQVSKDQDLVAHWSFDNDASDSSGNNVDGILLGGAKVQDGKLVLDGVNDFVDIPDHPALNAIKKEVTVAAWVSKPTKSGPRVIFDGYNDHGNSRGFGLWTTINSNNKLWVSFAALRGRDPQAAARMDDPAEDMYLVGTFDGSTRRIYVNGVLLKSNTAKGEFSDTGFSRRIGGQKKISKQADRYFEGSIDDVKIFNKALSDVEILDLYTESVVPSCDDGTLYGECSVSLPSLCEVGTLVSNCAACGCASGFECGADGSCAVPVETATCSDGTFVGACSSDLPKSCTSTLFGLLNVLVNDCGTCGCASGLECVAGKYCVGSYSLDDCNAGIAQGECTFTAPYVCDAGLLIPDCNQCGCAAGFECSSGICSVPSGDVSTPVDDVPLDDVSVLPIDDFPSDISDDVPLDDVSVLPIDDVVDTPDSIVIIPDVDQEIIVVPEPEIPGDVVEVPDTPSEELVEENPDAIVDAPSEDISTDTPTLGPGSVPEDLVDEPFEAPEEQAPSEPETPLEKFTDFISDLIPGEDSEVEDDSDDIVDDGTGDDSIADDDEDYQEKPDEQVPEAPEGVIKAVKNIFKGSSSGGGSKKSRKTKDALDIAKVPIFSSDFGGKGFYEEYPKANVTRISVKQALNETLVALKRTPGAIKLFIDKLTETYDAKVSLDTEFVTEITPETELVTEQTVGASEETMVEERSSPDGLVNETNIIKEVIEDAVDSGGSGEVEDADTCRDGICQSDEGNCPIDCVGPEIRKTESQFNFAQAVLGWLYSLF
jgi:hypothetical protein